VFTPEEQSTTIGFAKVSALLIVPYSLLGPFAGVFVDRWSRRRILVLVPLLRAAAMVGVVPLVGEASDSIVFLALALGVLSGNRLFLVTASAVTPRLVPERDLLVANSLSTVGGTFFTIIGVATGGLLAEAFGEEPVAVITAVLWLSAALSATRIVAPISAERGPEAPWRHELGRVAHDLADGARRLVRTPRAVAPISSYVLDQFVQGLILVVSFVVFRERFEQGVGSFSWLVAAGAVGTFVGLSTAGWLEPRLAKPRIVALAFVVSGVPLLAVAPFVTGFTVLVASFFLGVGYAWKKIPVDTMVQQAIPDAYRGRVFAVYDVGQNMARVVAAIVAIAIVREEWVSWLLAGSGLVFLLWAPVLPRWAGPEPEVLVRAYAGARADEVPRSVVLAGVEHEVEVERSWREERDGERRLSFRLRLDDGRRIEVSRPEDGERWRVDRELDARSGTGTTE
jgi:MFS family permease